MVQKVGLRYNKGKISYRQLSPVATALKSMVSMFGGLKYHENNYKFFKGTEEEAVNEYLDCIDRHLWAIKRGEFFDPESKMPHASHIAWNSDRLVDLYYYGMTHMKDGKDLFQQPLRHELPPVPTEDNFEAVWGMTPHNGGKLKEEEVPFESNT
jgi:hypothetical protein